MIYLKNVVFIFLLLLMAGCISTTNKTVEGGTPDVTQCSPIEGVLDGADFVPKSAITEHEDDGRTHPDLFYIAWAQLDARVDLRSPEKGYDEIGFEDKLLVSRKQQDGSYKTWQIYPAIDNECKDVEKVRIQSFDVAPDGKSLYLSISKPVFDEDDTLKVKDLNPDRHLGIFKLDISSKKLTPITHDYSVSYSYPTYIGNDENSDHEMLLIAKTVTKKDIPLNYKIEPVLRDEYDRHPTPLIHKLDTVTGAVTRIGFNNSHQTEPVVVDNHGLPLVVFNQWEHQHRVNRFSLWKMQIDGSDEFMFFGEEASVSDTSQNLYSPREIKSGKYKNYIIMGQGGRIGNESVFLSEGDIIMTKRENLDLRSKKIVLSKIDTSSGVELNIARSPEHYNNESFVYAYRENVDSSYKLYIKDYPENLDDPIDNDPGTLVISSNSYHFMQPRSFYPPVSKKVAPGVSDLSENRVSFTNNYLNGKSGFLVENLGDSDNGEQNQLDGIDTDDVRLQFYVPSHDFSNSYAIGFEKSQELAIPTSKFIAPESDGSLGVVLKEGLYIWKAHKRFTTSDGDLWIPIRSERQEVNFVPNRVNQCNQCHQDRNQDVIDQYHDYNSIASDKMHGNLSDMLGTDRDISEYNATKEIPDFHKQIIPLLNKTGLNGGKSCVDCHNEKDKLNLSNATGVDIKNTTYRNFVLGAHKMSDESVVPYQYEGINQMGMDNDYHPAPFLWSLILDDDLSVPSDSNHSDSFGKSLDRDGDFGAKYSQDIENEIKRINLIYDHSKHWSLEDKQKVITYGATRLAIGLSDKVSFTKNNLAINTNQSQKAYQSLIRNCYSCHNNHTKGGLHDSSFEDIIPKEKRFNNNYYLKDETMRFSIYHYLENKDDTKYSQYIWESNLPYAMYKTLNSALYRVDFNDLNNSELLVYARGYYKEANGTETPLNDNIKAHTGHLTEDSADYKAIENWINGVEMTNQAPTIDLATQPIVIKEYDAPAYLSKNITWSDADSGDLSQLFISGTSTSEHTFNDTMLSLEYNNFISAKLKTYAILGDRGEHNLTFTISDGLTNGDVQKVPITITSDYIVPKPLSTLPKSYLFFTDRNTSMLRRLETNGTVTDIGKINGFNNDWTTVYRRADKGWLYFLNQEEQKIYVVSETNASILFNITLDNESNQVGTEHKQTLYLIWWRPTEGNVGDANYSAGGLEGLLESKLSSDEKINGDFYVELGDGEDSTEEKITPKWKTKLVDGGNTIGVYVWRRATFMTKWVNEEIDRMNVLNLVTGKSKYLTDFNFTAQTIDGVEYKAKEYWNVRAIVVAEDGAFYGFNKDLNGKPVAFNFDPILGIQKSLKVNIPDWLQTHVDNFNNYATPFLVIEPRD
jgi:hypothetical protein